MWGTIAALLLMEIVGTFVGSPLVMRRYLRETEMANLNPLVGTTQMVVEFTYGDEVVRYVYEPIKIMPINKDCDIERDAW